MNKHECHIESTVCNRLGVMKSGSLQHSSTAAQQHSSTLSWHWNLGADPGYGQGGGPASEAKCCCIAEQSHKQSELSTARVQGQLKGPRSFWIFNVYAFPHILETPFLSFLTSTSTPTADKNRTLDCTSINFWDIFIYYTHFLIFMKKLSLWLYNFGRYAEQSQARKFYDMDGEK